MEKISRGSNKGQKLKEDLLSRNWNTMEQKEQNFSGQMSQKDEENLRKAVEHKNKLIDYDRTSAKRTQVIDDESDYFNTNSKWLSQQQKAQLENKEKEFRNKRFGSKLNNQRFTIDFAGRKIFDEIESLNLDEINSEIDSILKNNQMPGGEQAGAVVNLDLDSIKLKFVEEKSKKKSKKENESDSEKKKKNSYRIQNSELQEMKDEGMCLTMHQPWASLLVAGIKKYYLFLQEKN